MEGRLCSECGREVEAGRNTCLICLSDMPLPARPASRGLGLAGKLMIAVAIFIAVGFLALPAARYSGGRNRPLGRLTACRSNLKNIGTALEMYGTDNKGLYPPTLAAVVPGYLKQVPTCPSASADTYSAGYARYVSRPVKAGRAAEPDAYSVVCVGTYHGQVQQPANYPQYSSQDGIISP